MRILNEVILSGNLGADPEIKPDGRSAVLSLATSRRWKDADGTDREETTWHRVILRGRMVGTVNASQFLTKGERVLIIGEARHYSYVDGAGATSWMHEVAAHTVAVVLMAPKEANHE